MASGAQARRSCRFRGFAVAAVAALCALPTASVTHAVDCPVPTGSHATILSAVIDPNCTSITLAAQSYPESVWIQRTLSIEGQGALLTRIDGRVQVAGAATGVGLNGFAVRNGCSAPGVQILANASATLAEVRIEPAALPCPPELIFADGFASGNTSRWN